MFKKIRIPNIHWVGLAPFLGDQLEERKGVVHSKTF
jgi:hypothetical protein